MNPWQPLQKQVLPILQKIFAHPLSAWVIILAGLTIRVMYAIRLYPEFLPGDAFWYYDEARKMVMGTGIECYWPPGLILYLTPHLAFWGASALAVVPAMLLAWLLTALAWQRTSRKWLPAHWTHVGQLMLALWPAFIHQSVVPLSHLLIAWGLLVLIRHVKVDIKWWQGIGMGIVWTILILTRPGTLALLPVWLFFLLYRPQQWQRWLALVLMLGIVGGALVKWEQYAYEQTGRWVRLNDANAYNVYLGNNAWTPDYRTWWLGSHDERGNPDFTAYYTQLDSIDLLEPAERQQAFQSEAWGYIRSHPGTFLLRMANRARTYWAFDTLAGSALWRKDRTLGIWALVGDATLYLLLGIGLIWAAWHRRSSLPKMLYLLIWGMMAAYMLPYLIAFSHPTYHLPLIPLALIQLLGLLRGKPISAPDGGSRPKWGFIVSLLVFGLIQLEWASHMLARMNSI